MPRPLPSSPPVSLRPHHLLCLQGFQGYGYSEDFIVNMGKVRHRIMADPYAMASLVCQADAICSHCPNRVGTDCGKGGPGTDVGGDMDRKVLGILGLREGASINAATAMRAVNDKLSRHSEAMKVCGSCEWSDRCLWLSSRLVRG